MVDRIQTNFSTSLVSKDGSFSGYGAVFNNIDSHRDIIQRGAFSTSLSKWRAKGRWPPMRLMHGDGGSNPFRFDDLPVGRYTNMREDARGLWVTGQLIGIHDTEIGRRLFALMSSPGDLLSGLSIGFRVVKSSPGTGAVKRYLEQIDLKELSLVTDPSNDEARVTPISASEAAADRLRDALTAAVADAQPKHSPDTTSDDAYSKMIAALRAVK